MSDNRMRHYRERDGETAGPERTRAPEFGVFILLLALVAPGCRSSAEDPGALAIAEVAGRQILLREFEPMLTATSSDPSGELTDSVKSRLLDQFLEQQVLVQEARQRGIEVQDDELQQALARDGRADEDAGYREEVRTSLIVEKFLRTVLAESSDIAPEEEERFFQENPELFRSPAVMVLRQILLEDPKTAARLQAELVKSPERFEEAARQYSLSPDHGDARVYTVDELPREAFTVLKNLEAGEVSPVVEMQASFLIFLMEELRKERNVPLEEARPQIRVRLQEARGSGAVARLLADLRVKMGVRVYEDHLPFQYVQEDPA